MRAPETAYNDEDLLDEIAFSASHKENDYRGLERSLDSATHGPNQYLSSKTAQRWFNETIKQESPDEYFQHVIVPRMQKWERMRSDFDDLNEYMDKHGEPLGFTVLKPDAFWRLPAKERFKYLENANDALKKQGSFEERWEKISEKVREYTRITFDELHAASKKQTQDLLEGLKHKPKDEKELEGWEQYVNGTMQDAIASARKLYFQQFMDPLLDELGKSISSRTIKELQENFWDEKVDYKEKERYVLNVLPERIAQWKAVRLQRDRLLKHPGLSRLKSGTIKDFNVFLDTDKFLALKYPKRKGLADMIESLLLAQDKGMELLHRKTETELRGYVSDGRLHRTKVGTWLKRIFTASSTTEDVENFMKKTVRPYAERWKLARVDFDKMNKRMSTEGVPRGLRRHSLNQFLLLDYDDRIVYLEEAESRLESDVNEEGPLAALRLDIRHAMDTGDWEEAEKLLLEAQKLDPDDKAVRSMERYLERNRTDKKGREEGAVVDERQEQQNKGAEALIALRKVMNKLPVNMRFMIEKALKSSKENTLKRICQGYGNVVWLVNHGYSNPVDDREKAKEKIHKLNTAKRIADGHERDHEINEITGDTANSSGIRGDCDSPQEVFTDRSGLSATYEAFEDNADNAKFGYWTSIKDKEIPYELLREAVLNHFPVIKDCARKLRQAKIPYSTIDRGSSSVVQRASVNTGSNTANTVAKTTMSL